MQHQLTRTRRSGVFAARRRARGLRLDNLGLGIPGPCGAKPMSYAWGAHLSLAAPLGLEFDVAPISGAPCFRRQLGLCAHSSRAVISFLQYPQVLMTGFLPPLLQPDRRIDNSGRLEDLCYLIDEASRSSR